MRRSFSAGIAACLILVLTCPQARARALGLSDGRRRRVALFDFEERDRNPNPLPEHWFAMGRIAKTSNPNFGRYPLHQKLMSLDGFPHYTEVRFDTLHSASGQHSFYLGLNGGSAGAFLEVGAVGAIANSDYLITARVRTTRLSLAQARVMGYFIDRKGDKVGASISTSPPVRTDGKWQNVTATLSGDFGDVAWIGLQIELRQPKYDTTHPLASDQIVLQEIHGGAWFDDIAVWQLPRLIVRSQSDVNIVRPPQRPQLSVRVIDLTGQNLLTQVTLYDHRMQPAAQSRRMVGPGKPSQWRWEPPIDRFGWYLIDMQVRQGPKSPQAAAGDLVARKMSSFLWLGSEGRMHPQDATKFLISAEDVPDEQLALLAELMDKSELDGVVLSSWHRDTTLAQIGHQQSRLDDLLRSISSRRRQIRLSLYPMPDELAQRLDIAPANPMMIFGKSLEMWRPFLAPVLMRHGQLVRHWQVAPVNSGDAFFYEDLVDRVDEIQSQLGSMAPDPVVVLPWQITQSRRSELGDRVAYSIRVPPWTMPQELGNYLHEWISNPPARYSLFFDMLPATQMTQLRRVNDLVRRMLYAWEVNASRMVIQRPWARAPDRRVSLVPDPLLGAFSGVAHRLAGRRVVGRLPLGHDMECMIFDGPSGGMLGAWRRSDDEASGDIAMFLGKQPVAIDLWGNRSPLAVQEGRHHLQLTRTPLFIEGIDPELALFRAGFRVNEPFIESKQILHQRAVTLTNPWPRTISGHMIITGPPDWAIQPRRTFFSIASGRETRIPVTIRFPISEVAGRKRLVARFEFTAIEKYDIEASTAMELGLRDVEFDAVLSFEANATGGLDAVVSGLITNKADKIVSLRAFAFLDGYPRQLQPVMGLRPGQSIVRDFRFPDVPESIWTAEFRVGLRELAGPAVLNQIVSANDAAGQ